MKLVVAISGASGASLGAKFIDLLPDNIETFVILTDNAKVVFEKEENLKIFDDSNIAESIASGSFKTDAMAIIPTSMNTLAKVSVGISDNLTTRVASVMIKEKRKLLLAPREMPLSQIHLEYVKTIKNRKYSNLPTNVRLLLKSTKLRRYGAVHNRKVV